METAGPAPIETSLLHRALTGAGAPPEASAVGDPTQIKLLDAAREVFCRVGMQRASMEEVARLAGVSRVTLYRKFATKNALAEAVVTREFRHYFRIFREEVTAAPTAADRVVFAFVSSLRTVRGNPLIASLLVTEPQQLIGAADVAARMVASVARFVAQQLRSEQAAGNVPDTIDVDVTAEMMVRISMSFLTIPSLTINTDDDGQLADIARRYIVPMLGPG
ncbi:TetR family transcriptional regulator [Gordonia pseudamarae]|uniref:TetR family transcriptional regulator n=1 Tax=Gordonia pseudamarae TaxID=2831662 RepID=A0ABX6IP00_9ACTN|nr:MULTISPECIES: TetR/AcrR family transcriptional regulator [Gordonia]MBD0023847.1 TetR/AcrR family transcriptional regulator [Gordonia sp. (in: high G+C Gram-positive bacteria)]QHN28148.1 TetR family transcriptional regulator [Gordonia pseudamarae]QHN37011.1 TetR family transcriptional regulator [Gordonia pseudamarae]